MKKILIAGKDSYLGTSFENYMGSFSEYGIDSIKTTDRLWINRDFSKYDAVVFVAGIVHIKKTKSNEHLFYDINRDLAVSFAEKAKKDGARQFVYISSMSVYGNSCSEITIDTATEPNNAYGRSKLEAERLLSEMSDNNFTVAIIRPPMIYGKNCKGNYPRLSAFVLKSPVFPNIVNKRSMIYVDNLCACLKILVDDRKNGIYVTHNSEYVCTSRLASLIAENHKKKIYFTRFFNPIIRLLGNASVIRKMFGDLYYAPAPNLIQCDVMPFSNTIKETESK